MRGRAEVATTTSATIGASFSRRVTFDAKSIRDFATLTGDCNPLHHDEAAAARGPFGSLIVTRQNLTFYGNDAMAMGGPKEDPSVLGLSGFGRISYRF